MNILKPITSLFTPKAAPLVEARAAAPMSAVIQPKAQDRLYELIEREQLPGDVRETLAGALTGDLPRQQLLFQAMIDTWPRLQKNLTEVARSVSSTPWEIQPYSEQGDEPTESAIEKARMVQTAIENMSPRPAWDELSERGLVKSLTHGYYMGHQVCEVFWDRKAEGTMPRSAKIVPPRFYDYPDTGEDRLMFSPDGGFYSGNYEDFPEHHFLIAVNRGHGAHPSIAAPLRALTGYWLAATFGLKWLLQFTQLYGIPFRWAEYEDESVKSKVCNMLENIGSAGWGAFPKGTKLDFVNAGQSADSLPQAMLLEMADKQCDTFILGQTLTTDVGDSGSRALGDVHQDVRAGVIQGVNDFVSDIFSHQLIPSIIQLNYGSDDEMPTYSSTVEAPKDEIGMAQRDQTLISMGMEVGKEWLYERHGVPMPEEGDDDIFQPSGGNGAGGDPQTGSVLSNPNETDPAEADPDQEVEASMVRAYDPSQKRAEKGSDNGGQWVKEDGSSSKGDRPKKSLVSEADSKRYSELEAKFNEGTITDEELGEAHDLVEKAAKAAGYDTEKVYHGTDTEFEVFDDKELGTATDSESAEKAFFFSDDEKTAKAYANWAAEEGPVKEALAEADRAEKLGDWDAYDKAVIKSEELAASAYERRMAKARVIPAYLKGNFLEVDADGLTPQELKGSGGDIDLGISLKLDEAKEGGYDGVIFRNLDDAVGLYDRPSDHYAVFNPNQIKSADIFTGTPLAERFNEDDDRITFSHAVQAYDPNQKRAKDGRWTDGAISRGVIDKVERSHIDSYDGQDDYELVAYKGDDIMGYLSYSEHEGDVSISMVETRETHKRKGIATELYKELVKLHGEKAISSSFATEEGAALRKALEKRGIIKKDGTVIKSAAAHAVQAYDPNQKRAEKGADNGGQWVKEGGGTGASDEGELLKPVNLFTLDDGNNGVENHKLPITFLRAGDLPIDEEGNVIPSFAGGPMIDLEEGASDEGGVSVYEAYKDEKTGFYIVKSHGGSWEAGSYILADRPVYEISGETIVRTGADDEPLILPSTAKLGKKVKSNKIIIDHQYRNPDGDSEMAVYVASKNKTVYVDVDFETVDGTYHKLEKSPRINKKRKLESANATRPTIDQLSDNVLESLTGVTREWLSPVRPHFEKLAAMAMSKQVSDADFIEALEKSQRDIPELFDKLNVEALQTSMEDAIGTAMIAGSVERYEAGEVKAAYDPNQPRDPGGEGGGQWIKEGGSEDDLKLYHGTKAKIDEFDLENAGDSSGFEAFGRGIYLTMDKKDAEFYAKDGGKVYEVAFSGDNDALMDWNKPIKDQPQKVKDAFISLAGEGVMSEPYSDRPASTIYNNLMLDKSKPTTAQVTSKMQKAGIEGIIHKVENNSGGQSSNIVIFNPDDLAIEKPNKLESSAIQAYDPNQKRGEAGTPDGGRWVSEGEGSNDLKRFSSYDDLYRGLNNDLVDQGKYGAVFDVGVDGFLLKASSDDPAYEKYIKFIEENKPESSLYPKVKDSWNLEDGSFSTLVERVTPALKRADAYQIEDMLDIMAMGEDLPENYKILAESLGFTENDYSAFLDTIKDMGGDDIHVGNIGFRDNGELVIFDPVKPSNAKP